MNSIKNSVYLIGNLGVDPEITKLDSGQHLTKFSMATNEVYKNKEGEQVEKTEWHRIVAWGDLAKKMNDFLNKGNLIALNGKLEYNKYTDKNGIERYDTQIKASSFLSLSPKA